ncbi:pur operon repressor [Tuberibacillus sp. Marseille-P3662]|uniref:pur operon repressor n=1 Tax=Tuberibacillus sp. Marseille-P3662 TaxID=1965358 RepID=UPI000A1CAAE7|nr:pur operon repressor [Tuberibacillus sp. Marseille-P3662]
MKMKRSGRLVDMTHYLLSHPHEVVSLSFFSERYESAKSSISEDLVIVKQNFESQGVGWLKTIAGASGGVIYVPFVQKAQAAAFLKDLEEQLASGNRLLPGGYLYMTDILGQPAFIRSIGQLIASIYAGDSIDTIITVETKGIPLAYAVASQLNTPVVIARKSSKVTEGSTVSINYVSGSTKRIQSMVLPRRSLTPGARVLIIDDFMKAGGTIRGMKNLIQEFDAVVAGAAVLVETKEEDKLVDDYVSLLKLSISEGEQLSIENGSYFNYYKEVNWHENDLY